MTKMIVAEREVYLPCNDENLIGSNILYRSGNCLYTEPINILDKLPQRVKVVEMNMLAFILEQFDHEQVEKFSVLIEQIEKTNTAEILNIALAVCPEAAGFEKGSSLKPVYNGNNLYELMEYKRLADRKQKYPGFQFIKCHFPVTIKNPMEEDELSKLEAADYQAEMSAAITAHYRGRSDINTWCDYGVALAHQSVNNKFKVLFERMDVEIFNGELCGVCILETDRTLTGDDLEVLKECVHGARLESWSEGEYEIDTPTGAYVLSFDDDYNINNISICQLDMCLTPQEELKLQAPYNFDHLINPIELVP